MLHYHMNKYALENLIWLRVMTAGLCCLILKVCTDRSTCFFATEYTYRTETARPHIMHSTRWQSRAHRTVDHAYKLSIYIKHLCTFSVCIPLCIEGLVCLKHSVKVICYQVGCCVGWNAWNKLWPQLWKLKWYGAQRYLYYSFRLLSLSSLMNEQPSYY